MHEINSHGMIEINPLNTIKAPVELVPEDGKLVVRVTDKNGNAVGIKMGTDFETSDIDAVIGFAKEVYNMGFNDAKQTTKPQENHKPPKFIGVIANNVKDFQEWKENKNLIPTGLNSVKKFAIDNTMYVCLSKLYDCKGYTFDELVETNTAYLNSKYQMILEAIKPYLKSKKIY